MPISDSNECAMTCDATVKLPTAAECRREHFFLAQRIIDVVSQALDDELEPYRYVQTLKDGNATVLDCSTLPALNEERLARIVKILGDLFEMQRCAVGIPCVKEKNDLQNARRKLEQERYIADRKLDFELMKLEREYTVLENQGLKDDFLRALGTALPDETEDDEDHERSGTFY